MDCISLTHEFSVSESRMSKGLKTLFLVGMVSVLSACAHGDNMPPSALSSPASQNISADLQLAEAASSVTQSLSNLAAVNQAAHPSAKIPTPPDPNSYGMGNLVSIDWSGPVEPLVRKMADASHYSFRILGVPPSVPVLVSVMANNEALGDVLRNVGYQCGKRADILIFPSRQLIELRYNAV